MNKSLSQEGKIKLLNNGEIQYYDSYYKVNNADKNEADSRVLICNEDREHYHLFLNCFKKQPYKDIFNYWELVSLSRAQEKGLSICPACEFKSLPDDEKVQQILKDSNYIIVRLSASTSDEIQHTLSLSCVAEYVYIEYDYDKNKYIIIDKYDNKLGTLPQRTVNKLETYNNYITNFTCIIYSIEVNNNDNFICDIAVILGEKQQNIDKQKNGIDKKQNIKNKITVTPKPLTKGTIDRCTRLDEIIRIDYNGEAVPENASVVTLKNKHKFSAQDFFATYGYQVHRTKKLRYFFFLDKSRKSKDANGNKIYPAIKITDITISHIPDLSTAEAKKYIAIGYAERASKNYVVPAEEIDDLSHYRTGKYLYEEYKRMNISDYCVIDIETTGLRREYDQIIEMSAIRIRNNVITDKFSQLVKPTVPISAEATIVNNITEEMVRNASSIKEILPKFINFVGNDIVMGHNVGFDLEFIIDACNKIGLSFKNAFLDTLAFAQFTFENMPNYRLSTLCKELSVSRLKHKAESDCISIKELYDKLKESNYISKYM